MQCARLCVCVPLSVSWYPQWGNWRSRWNAAADISSGAMNKSIKQHTHTYTQKHACTKTHAQTKGSILLGLYHPQNGLKSWSKGSRAFFHSLWKIKSAQKTGCFCNESHAHCTFAFQGTEKRKSFSIHLNIKCFSELNVVVDTFIHIGIFTLFFFTEWSVLIVLLQETSS